MKQRVLISLVGSLILAGSSLQAAQNPGQQGPTGKGNSAPTVIVIPDALPKAAPARKYNLAGGKLDWQTEVRQALAAAKADQKMVLVYFYTDWCGFCRRMDEQIFPQAALAALGKNTVFLRLNAEDGGQGQHLALRFGVGSFPTMIFANHEGKLLGYTVGYLPSPEKLTEVIDLARSQAIGPELFKDLP